MKCPNSFHIKIRGSQGRTQEVPCGYCEICRKAKALEWSTRLLHELKSKGDVGMFVTLTYDDENIPMRGLYATLNKPDLVKYIKRLRNEKLKFTYYCVGEYGETYGRPHYHCLLFGLDVRNPEHVKNVKEKWRYGIVDIGITEVKSIHYCVGYIRKKLGGYYERVKYRHKSPVFSISSQKLGLEWINKNKKYLVDNDRIKLGGYDVAVPRYYVKKGVVDKGFKQRAEDAHLDSVYEGWTESDFVFLEDYVRFMDQQNAQKNINIAWKNKNMRRKKL